MKYNDAVPVIACSDVRAAVDYYLQVLGFREHFVFGEPAVYAGVERDGVILYLTLNAEFVALLKHARLHPEVFLWVEKVDEVFKEHKMRGATIFEDISDRAWDARQYVIEDPSGYHLKIAEPLDHIGR